MNPSALQYFNTSILPEAVQAAVAPLFDELPFEEAMPELLPRSSASKEAHRLASEAVKAIADPPLQAGIWLYVDDLEACHRISQGIHDATGSYWHAIMHRREGDFSNSKYWLRRAGSHPVWSEIEGYDPFAFVDKVAARHRKNPAELVDLQRREWWALFSWCASRSSE